MFAALLLCLPAVPGERVTLIEDGVVRCVIVAPKRVLEAKDGKDAPAWNSLDPMVNERRLRDSVRDLAAILGRITGAKVDVVADAAPAGDKRLPLLIGDLAMKTFGPPKTKYPFAQGLHNSMGNVWYRATVKLPELPAGKKTYLWLGATDGSVKVFVNGKHVPHVGAKGAKGDAFSGFCEPTSFDITSAIQAKADNQVSLLCTRTFLNELGTGGLLAAPVIYREK